MPKKLKTVKGWVVLNHKKKPQIDTFRKTKSSAEWNMRLMLSPDEVDVLDWDTLSRRGFHAVNVLDWDTLSRRGFHAVKATMTIEVEA